MRKLRHKEITWLVKVESEVNSKGRTSESEDATPSLPARPSPTSGSHRTRRGEGLLPFPTEGLSRCPWRPGLPTIAAEPGLTQPFIRAGDRAPPGPTAAQVGSPSRLRFRETLPLSLSLPQPWPRPPCPRQKLRGATVQTLGRRGTEHTALFGLRDLGDRYG